MSSAFFQRLFGSTAKSLQEQAGSRAAYRRREAEAADARDRLSPEEIDFLLERDSVYLGSVTTDGWPYIQHRGGPAGFIRSIGENRIAFAEYPGNRQFISLGNVLDGGRVSLFAMDYRARRRLKLIGHGRVATVAAEPALADLPAPPNRPAGTAIVVDVVGFDWNCPQYIEPRFTRADLEPLLAENAALRAEVARLAGELPRS